MKHFLIPIAIAIATLTSCNPNNNSTDTLRIMSHNVRNCKGMDLKLDYDRCADVINRAQPDIVAVQELDSMTSRYEGYYALGELATRTKMHDYYAPSIKYKGGKYGIGILSKEPAISLKQYPLPCRKEPRTMLVAEFDKFYFICTHLSLIGEDQVESVRIKLYKTALMYLGSESLALDAVDEAVYKALCGKWKLRQPEFFDTWISRILINECHNELRRQKRYHPLNELPETVTEEFDSLPLKEALRRLPKDLKDVIILRFFAGYSVAETAQTLHIPTGTVATRQRKALQLLRLELEEEVSS